jgi:formylglycine-generating enzyme
MSLTMKKITSLGGISSNIKWLSVSLILVFSLNLNAQCYNAAREEGIKNFNNENYERALLCFETARDCPDVPSPNDLNSWIGSTNDRIQAQIEERDFNSAARSNTLAAYESYLNSYPDGKFIVSAAERMLQLLGNDSLVIYLSNSYYKGNLYGYKTFEGNYIIIPANYEDAGNFNEGRASVKRDNKWGYINKTGQAVIPFRFDDCKGFKDGLATVKMNNNWGIIEKNGRWICQAKYDMVDLFNDGLAVVILNEKYGVINKEGKEVIVPEYSFISAFHEDLASVRVGNKYGFIDKSGQQVIPLLFDYAWGFSEGLAAVCLDKKWGYIDKNNQKVIPFIYDYAESFIGDSARVTLDNKKIKISRNGNRNRRVEISLIENDYKPEIEWVTIPGGLFVLGSPSKEPKRDDDETQHLIHLSGFKIGKYEITFDQYDAFCQATGRKKPSDSGRGRGNLPVNDVSWEDANSFAKWMGCRLPTEAEWEYACRAGTTTPFNTGDCITTDQANFDGRKSYKRCGKSQFRGKAMLVGSFRPNAWGLYDMHGNVEEWCSDWYEYYINLADHLDPTGPSSGKYKVARGGSYYNEHRYTRSANRNYHEPSEKFLSVGFRLVKND